MAKIVFAMGSSHSPILNSPPEDVFRHVEIDKGLVPTWRRKLVDWSGNNVSYEELLALAPPNLEAECTDEVITDRIQRCHDNIDRLSTALLETAPDVAIIVGDDQHEQFFEDNMPSISVYWGDTIMNNVLDLPEDAPEFWKHARSMYHETVGPKEYPVASKLGRHLIEHLVAEQFDVSHSTRLPRERGEGHAFAFVHKRLMRDNIVPVVPISLNTYFPPNQPSPKRCYDLGRALRDAISSWPENTRVALIASGGLSHFTVDEELDRGILEACRVNDSEVLMNVPLNKLRAGNSEIRNWITVAGAAAGLTTEWQDYVPYYRSEAGTGVGAAFAVWS
jgi:hypothetical protein